MKVLIASCIRQPLEILKAFLQGLDALEKPEDTDCFFILDNLSVEATDCFKKWMKGKPVEYEENDTVLPYLRTEVTHVWTPQLVEHVAAMKNRVLDKARNGDYDYLFFTDSDQVFHPKTIIHLISIDEPIIGEISWARWQPNEPLMPNAWFRHPYEFDGRMLELREPTVHEVRGMGGCYLIHRMALHSNISFTRVEEHPNWGEDRHFAIRAEKIGWKLLIDATYPYFHIYRDSDLPRLEQWIKQGYREPKVELIKGTVLIAVCIGEKEIHPDTSAWITRTLLNHRGWGLDISRAHPIDSNRNIIVRKFMLLPEAQKYEWLLFLDTDVVPPDGAVDKLLAHNKNIVGGVCPIMGVNGLPIPNISKDIDRGYVKAELMEVNGMGTGFMLIHREVLEAVGKSPFRFRYDAWGTASVCGEDYDFCEKAVKKGYKIYVDLGVQCEHYKQVGLLNLNRKLADILNRDKT